MQSWTYCRNGSCTTNWTEYDTGLYCHSSGGYLLKYQLRDLDGHLSEPYELYLPAELPQY